jgi:hypothetical protein
MQGGQILRPNGQWDLVSQDRLLEQVSGGQSQGVNFELPIFDEQLFRDQSPTAALRDTSIDSARPRRTGPSTNAGTSRSGANERLVARRGNSVR